jgi:hypothetical protein
MSRDRRVQRVHLALPLMARLGATPVVVVDVSVLGARVEHHVALGTATGGQARLTFTWEEDEIVAECRIVRSRLERFSVGTDGLTVYHSGLEFLDLSQETRESLKRKIGIFIARALHEQKLNARGVLPESVEKMPIFRSGGLLTENPSGVAEAIGSSALPTSRVAAESGYICFQLEKGSVWRKKRTHDPGQPSEGFTISATEDHAQMEKLCEAYAKSDRDGRKMIQLFAQLSIAEGEGITPGRFDP